VGHARVSGTTASVPVSCTGTTGATCVLALRLTVAERFEGRRLVAITARRHVRTRRELLVVGSTDVTLTAGQSRTVLISLNRAGRHLLASRHHLETTLHVSQLISAGQTVSVSTQTLTFKRRPARRHEH
jgi:hypothetical protein